MGLWRRGLSLVISHEGYVLPSSSVQLNAHCRGAMAGEGLMPSSSAGGLWWATVGNRTLEWVGSSDVLMLTKLKLLDV